MAMLSFKPTRMELSRIRRRLQTAKRGHKLLKDKRDEMIRRYILLVRENAALRKQVEKELKSALGGFALARAVMDSQSMQSALMYPARQVRGEVDTQNILSVHVPKILVDENSLKETIQPYGYAETSADLDDAISTLASLLPHMLRLAEVEKTCCLLADEIEKTRRRVNALEYVMIPQFENAIHIISMKLDENERAATVRLMRVKEMIKDRT